MYFKHLKDLYIANIKEAQTKIGVSGKQDEHDD